MARMPTQLTLADMEDSNEYRAFEAKFRPRKTTDECHTPEPVYEAVARWVADEFGVDRASFVRPFWPGGDFERYDYPEGCVVVDNPPFSILAHIVRTYVRHGVEFFLFAPALTNFTSGGGECCDITYANGANVRTGFLTSLDKEMEVRTAPDLTKAVNDAMERVLSAGKTELPKYVYPYEVLTAARGSWLSKWGADLRIPHGECVRVGTLDA